VSTPELRKLFEKAGREADARRRERALIPQWVELDGRIYKLHIADVRGNRIGQDACERAARDAKRRGDRVKRWRIRGHRCVYVETPLPVPHPLDTAPPGWRYVPR
jgi:hypothetical protein